MRSGHRRFIIIIITTTLFEVEGREVGCPTVYEVYMVRYIVGTRSFISCHVMAEFTRSYISCHVMTGSTWRFVSCHVMAGCNHRFISCHGAVRSGLPTVYDGYVV